MAGSMAVRAAVSAAHPVLLEPVMQLDVSVGEEFLGIVTADIGRRRGSIEAMSVRGAMRTLSGEVPLSEVRGYATDLRSMTQGRCAFTLAFRRFDFVPDHIAEDIIKERRAQGKIPIPRDTVQV
jgi:elongation factor G